MSLRFLYLKGSYSYGLSPLASRLSPLSVITALLIFLPVFLSGSPAAFASDWTVSYAYAPENLPVSDTGKCKVNGSITKTKTVTVTTTLTWTGAGSAPKRVKISEAASVSWKGVLVGPAVVNGMPPIPPAGSITGHGETGLTDVVTKDASSTDPSVISDGESIAGTREMVHSIPDIGVYVLPPVTLTATATTSAGSNATGQATVSLISYSVSVPDGWAWAEATVRIEAGSGWVAGLVNYGEMNDGSYSRENYLAQIRVSVGSGASKTKTLAPVQQFVYQGTNINDTPLAFTGNIQTLVEGLVSQVSSMFYAQSAVSVDGDNAPQPSSGYAPIGSSPGYGSASGNLPYTKPPVVNPNDYTSTLTVKMHLSATDSTIGH